MKATTTVWCCAAALCASTVAASERSDGDVLELQLAAGSECVRPGETVTVELHQRDLDQLVRGFQAFIRFDSGAMTFTSGTYTASPYGLPLILPIAADGDDINLAAGISDSAGQPPTMDDALLATFTFTAGSTEGPTTVAFRAHDPPTRFSDETGLPVTPTLVDAPPIVIDGTPPIITCPPDVTIECDGSTDPSVTGEATATDNLDPSPAVTFSDSTAPGTCPQEFVITRTWTATDCAGHTSDGVQIITIQDTTPPVLTCPGTPGFSGLILSEVVDGTLPGGMPKFVEITNCSDPSVDLAEYRIAIYANGGTVESTQSMGYGDMTGALIAGDSFVIAHPDGGPGAEFLSIYGFEADLYDAVANGNGNDVYVLLRSDGAGGDVVIDAYGVIGEPTGSDDYTMAWAYNDSYAYAVAGRAPNGGTFDAANWFFAGSGALDGATEPEMAAATTPGWHDCTLHLVVSAEAGGCDAVVTYPTATATDNCDLDLAVTCTPPSGSTLPSGATTVTCTTTDACGNIGTCDFDVIVEPVNDVTVTVELLGVDADDWPTPPLTRCIKFITRDAAGFCADPVHVPVDFFDPGGDRAVGTASFEVECGDWTDLCAKDEQHTLYDGEVLAVVDTHYELADPVGSPLALPPGDTDNDSDVDINDITWLMYQWAESTGATPAAPGGCPWDGTRDADFDNDNFFTSDDYLRLSGQWHRWETCACATAVAGNAIPSRPQASVLTATLAPDVARAVDVNRDGVVDYRDVQRFEAANGLPGVLSSQLRHEKSGWGHAGNTPRKPR